MIYKEVLCKWGYAEDYEKAEAEIAKAEEEEEEEEEEARIAEVVKNVPFMSKEKQAETLEKDGDKKEVVKALFASGMDIPTDKLKSMFTAEELAEVRMSEKIKADAEKNKADAEKNEADAKKNEADAEKNKADAKRNEADAKKNEAAAQKLEEMRNKFKQKEDKLQSEQATSINLNENLATLSDDEKKAKFDNRKDFMKAHPLATAACLDSMCEAYYYTEDKELKGAMLEDLYNVRKGGTKNEEKRDMAKTFKQVLENKPVLKNDENLVALSKVDTIVSRPTNLVKRQITKD